MTPAADMNAPSSLAVRKKGRVAELAHGSTRKRSAEHERGGSTSRRRMRPPSPDDDDEPNTAAFDPDQAVQERRAIQRSFRSMQQQLRDNAEELMKSNPKSLLKYLDHSNQLIKDVRQTSEAAIDARGLVLAADISARRAQRLTSGNIGMTIDVDEFVTKCISFMLAGNDREDEDAEGPTGTQTSTPWRSRGGFADSHGNEEDDEVDEGNMLNWAHLGRNATFLSNRRPACLPDFWKGPLMTENKVRKVAARSAPLRIDRLQEVKPMELSAEDMKKSEKDDLPAICKKIYERLQIVQQEAQDAVEDALTRLGDNLTAEQELVIMDQNALRSTGGVDLLRFVINPHSFGQTVENMFYVSFLIREGTVQLEFDENDLPSLESIGNQQPDDGGGSNRRTQRHQAIMSIDMEMWKDIIDAFGIKEPMIPHRKEEATQGPGARAWYS
ncbi:Nse4 C-terminal-domain-containing protein [Diplogelasinospora grovesii]|uniref:Non-structural maintenance of chromosomes element 4 n=1 Tax=Diplogelasinospora grovesii TaxID=303347 RepID=A0AAN6S053_9PEZI|nr:Nse4 C-terminal-domain-containing protein [Diplogelasinospora grovesii]